jgi:biotin carboxylase
MPEPGAVADNGWMVFVESNTTGTGRLFARAASELGYKPVVLAEAACRYHYLEEDGIAAFNCDTSSIAELRRITDRLAGQAPIAGIFSTSEYYVEAAAKLAELLALPGPLPDALAACRNKSSQRRILEKAGLRNPKHRRVISVADAVTAAVEIGLPVILKPNFGSGSVGVKLCRSYQEVGEHAAILLQRTVNERGISVPSELLVEEYVTGDEYSVETLAGTIVGITRKHVSHEPFFVETGHDFPATLAPEHKQQIASTVYTALKALDLNWGPTHIELRMTPAGPVIMEINPRLAGGFIPELVRLAHGVDMIRQTLKVVVGGPPQLQASDDDCASIRFLIPAEQGLLANFSGLQEARDVEGVCEVRTYRRIGDEIRLENDFRDRVGHVIARSRRKAAKAAQAAEIARDKIRIEIKSK